MSPLQIGLIGCLFLLVLLCTSMPVAFAMISTGVIGFSLIVSPYAAFSMVISDIFGTFTAYNLTVIPLFVLWGRSRFTPV